MFLALNPKCEELLSKSAFSRNLRPRNAAEGTVPWPHWFIKGNLHALGNSSRYLDALVRNILRSFMTVGRCRLTPSCRS